MEGTVEQAKSGDRQALASLVSEHYARVYRFCARRVGPELAQDAAQETFLTMQKAIRRYESKSAFPTWLLGIAHNHCRNISRKRRMDPAPLDNWFEHNEPSHNPSDPIVNREALRCALAELSPEHREVVLLHEIEGLRYLEIAEILGIPEGTVKSRLHHAFLNLRTNLVGGMV